VLVPATPVSVAGVIRFTFAATAVPVVPPVPHLIFFGSVPLPVTRLHKSERPEYVATAAFAIL
jgi:hypothetical protein